MCRETCSHTEDILFDLRKKRLKKHFSIRHKMNVDKSKNRVKEIIMQLFALGNCRRFL